MSARKKVREVAVELFGPEIGCYDGGCVYGHPGGMQTNGGCECLKSRSVVELTQHMIRLNRIALKLAENAREGK